MSYAQDTYSLVADIGGTNTRVALAHGANVIEQSIRRYRNSEFDGLEPVLKQYILDENDVKPVAACVAVAGPVADGKATMTNLDWAIDEPTLAHATNAKTVAIINDLQAQGHALGLIAPENLRSIAQTANSNPEATKLVVGIGTGFNAATVYELGNDRLVTPSESGHANLPVMNETGLALSNYIAEKHGFAAVEDVLSGRGLEQIYAFLSHRDGSENSLPGQDIMLACANGSDPRAIEAATVFAQMLGTVCGNLALIHLPMGGISLVGGMARAITPFLADFGFHDAFRAKGRFFDLVDKISINVVEDDYAALTGSSAFLAMLLARDSS